MKPAQALALAALALPVCGEDPGAGVADVPEEDSELIEALDLLLEWELLRAWDPAEDLPIPIAAKPEEGR